MVLGKLRQQMKRTFEIARLLVLREEEGGRRGAERGQDEAEPDAREGVAGSTPTRTVIFGGKPTRLECV